MDEMKVDEIDGSEHHNCISNKQLLCHSCNIKKGFQQKAERLANPALDTTWLQSSYATSRQAYVCVSAGTGASASVSEPVQADASKQIDEDETEIVHEERPFSEVYASRKKQSKPTGKEVKDDPNLTPTMRKNRECEKPFNQWLNQMLANGQNYSVEEWTNGGANQFDCSQETVWRYLKKRLDLPDCNPINGDLTLAPFQGKQVIVSKRKA